MATYSELEYSSITDLVVPFTTYNGINQYSTGTESITGYTLGVTEFTFTPTLSTLENTGFGVSLDKMIWDFGDGTYDTGYSVTKQYEFPGDYTVTTIFTDQNGVTHRNSKKQNVKVYNYVADAVQWYTPTIAYPNGGLPETCQCGRPSDDLTLFRYNSWQSWHMVSGDGGYFINLYAMGSRSMPLSRERYYKSPDIHFAPTWRFVENKDSTVPLDQVQTDINTAIYVKVQDGEIVHTTAEDPAGSFAGTSGLVTVNYIDDSPNRLISRRMPSLGQNSPAEFENDNLSDAEFEMINIEKEEKDLILYASFDTSKFPVTRYDKELSQFEILKSDYFQIYETQKVGLPIVVKFNEPSHLKITSNGIEGFEISKNKYLNSPFSVCTQVADSDNFSICATELPELSSHWSASTDLFSGGDATTDVLTGDGFVSLYLSGQDTTFTRIVDEITQQTDFQNWDVGKFLSHEPANSYIRLNIVQRTGEGSPDSAGKDIFNKDYKNTSRTVTLLAGHFTPQTLNGINRFIDDGKVNELYQIARTWTTRSGEEYYATMNMDSTYSDPNTLEMTIDPQPIDGKVPGAYNSLLNFTGTLDLNKENKYRVVAETIVKPPLYFNYDTMYYYMCNPNNDIFHQLKPVHFRNYTYGEDGFTQTYTSPLTTTTPGNSGLYGFAVEPKGDVIMVDGDTDKIIRHWRNNTARVEIPIHTLLPNVSANHYPGDPTEYGYTPSSVSLDSNLDYWVTLYDAVSTVKIDGETNQIIAAAVPPFENFVAQTRESLDDLNADDDTTYQVTQVNGPQGQYGENLIRPTIVETCANDDIVISYTNTVCSCLIRYDQSGNYLSMTDFDEDRVFPGDFCVDSSDHVWAVTESTGLNADGTPNMDIPKGMIYSYDEQLNYRLHIESVSGAEYQDIQTPTPPTDELIEHDLLITGDWDYVKNEVLTDGFLIGEFGPNDKNPILQVYEGNTYKFKNKFYNRGQHAVEFRELTESDLETVNDLQVSHDISIEGTLITENLSGFDPETNENDDEEFAIKITKDSPDAILIVNKLFPAARVLFIVNKKPVYVPRDPITFDIINNPTHITPDCDNNIWFSWGERFVSRYNVYTSAIDTTVAVGSAFEDARYDQLDFQTHDRRDNASRLQSIEGLGMDTGNNLLVINNADKKLYALYSNNITLSAYINVPNDSQAPYDYIQDDGTPATSSDFLSPESYLTPEQIKVFLSNTEQYDRQTAANRYQDYIDNPTSFGVDFRLTHARALDVSQLEDQEIRAGGDWTGFQWVNKYDNRVKVSDATTGSKALTGQSSEFTLLPQVGSFDIVKINEDVDFAGVIREYIRVPVLTEKKKFYNDFLNSIFGTESSSPQALGKRIYERIANFSANHNDIDTCTVQALISLASMTNYKLTEFGTSMPAELQRVVDLLSIKYTKLKGVQTDYQTDFEKYGNWDQQNIGVNLGAEIMFINEYVAENSYKKSDFVRHDGEYYQAVKDVMADTTPDQSDTEYWRHWIDGYVRSRHIDSLRITYKKYLNTSIKYKNEVVDDAWIMNKYNQLPILIKLVDKWQVALDEKYVLLEDNANRYSLVEVRAQNFLEQTEHEINLIDGKLVVSNPLSADRSGFDAPRRENEIMTDVNIGHELITIDEQNTITVMGPLLHENPTILLYRDRTYKFKVDSVGEEVEIVDGLGDDANRIAGFVSGQGTELGDIMIRTDTDPVNGMIPDVIYYRSVNDHTKGGKIVIKNVDEIAHYSTEFRGVTAYNIDLSYNSRDQLQRLGWGVDIPDGANAWQFYTIYEYFSGANTDQNRVSNVINWNDDADEDLLDLAPTTRGVTTLKPEQVKAYGDWSRDGGIADIVIEKTLREGLGLFEGIDAIDENYN